MAFLENLMLLFFSVKLVLFFTLIISFEVVAQKSKKVPNNSCENKKKTVEITHNSFEQALVDLRPTS